MTQTIYSKLKPYRTHMLYFFIIWWTPAYLEGIFGKYGGLTGGILQLLVLAVGSLFLLGSFLKSRNGFVLGLSAFLFFLAFIRLMIILNTKEPEEIADPGGLIIFMVSFLVILMTTHKFSSGFIWYRHLPLFLDLAAKPVLTTTNGYTNRPFPVGKAQYSKEEVIRFAKYLHKELIATSYIKEDRVVLIFSNGLFQYIPLLEPAFTRVTYVSFGYQGDISVNFARRDYKKYWDEITFDQLCNSLGNIVIDFFNAFIKKEGGTFFKKLHQEGLEIGQPEFNSVGVYSGEGEVEKMRKNKINYGWVVLSGIFAFFVFTTLEIGIEGSYIYLFDKHWIEVVDGITAHWGSWEKLVNVLIAVAKFILFMWVYAALIPRYGATKKNVLITSFILMVLLYLQVFNEMNLGMLPAISTKLFLREIPFNIIQIPAAIFAGAWLYRED